MRRSSGHAGGCGTSTGSPSSTGPRRHSRRWMPGGTGRRRASASSWCCAGRTPTRRRCTPRRHMPPDEVFDAALRRFLERRRVDMRSLAAELGIGRATLYRRTGSRDQLLGHVLWYLTERNLQRAVRHAEGLTGAARIMAVIGNFLAEANEQPSLRHFLATEPEAALRILTSKRGIVQPGVV